MSELKGAAENIYIIIRQAREEELEKILSLTRENFIYMPPKRILRLFRNGTLKMLIAILPTGDIIGTSWIVSYPGRVWSLIGGITLNKPNYVPIMKELFEIARSFLPPERIIYINSPTSLQSYFLTLSYLDCGNLYLYSCHTSRIVLPTCEIRNYSVEKAVRITNDKTMFRAREDNTVVGRGTLVYFAGNWLIGQLIAGNEVIAKLLFKNIMLTIRGSRLHGTVFAYVPSKMDKGFFPEFGFIKQATEWIRFCSIDLDLSMSRIYCLESVGLSIF